MILVAQRTELRKCHNQAGSAVAKSCLYVSTYQGNGFMSNLVSSKIYIGKAAANPCRLFPISLSKCIWMKIPTV